MCFIIQTEKLWRIEENLSSSRKKLSEMTKHLNIIRQKLEQAEWWPSKKYGEFHGERKLFNYHISLRWHYSRGVCSIASARPCCVTYRCLRRCSASHKELNLSHSLSSAILILMMTIRKMIIWTSKGSPLDCYLSHIKKNSESRHDWEWTIYFSGLIRSDYFVNDFAFPSSSPWHDCHNAT